jgi:uncharacterized spore protein YtfJ
MQVSENSLSNAKPLIIFRTLVNDFLTLQKKVLLCVSSIGKRGFGAGGTVH